VLSDAGQRHAKWASLRRASGEPRDGELCELGERVAIAILRQAW